MKKKNGFIAVSVIYSFFLVFLMIMLSVTVNNAQNRTLLSAIKEDIKLSLNQDEEFIVNTLPNRDKTDLYQIGDEVNFVGESWLVVNNKADSVVLVLKRALNQREVLESLNVEASDAYYFNNECTEARCKTRMCATSYSSNFCFYESAANYYYYEWDESIAKKVVDNWFINNDNLQKACRLQYDIAADKRICTKNTLINMTFTDGLQEYEGYIRIPTSEEANQGMTTWVGNNGGYYAPEAWTLTNANQTLGQSYGYDISGNIQEHTQTMTIRPVIEVRKN